MANIVAGYLSYWTGMAKRLPIVTYELLFTPMSAISDPNQNSAKASERQPRLW